MDQFMQSKVTNNSSTPTAVVNGGQPYVRVVEQPAKCALRFRYECEGRSAGSIPGSKATADNKTYPTIQVCNYRGQAVVVVSCVTKDQPYRPHPHNLVGKEGCKKGVCTMVINNQDMLCSFTSLGIQCVKRKDIEDSLKLRESIKVDPYRTGFSHKSQSSSIDLNVVRLCFQVFIEGQEKDKFTVQLPPIVSDPIYDKKAMTELIVTKLSHCSAPCNGGKEIILLCDRVTKDDVQVRFYQEMNGGVVWEAFADFGPGDVHKQVAICFRTPSYIDQNITQPVTVQLQLRRPSDGCTSDPRGFQLLPKEVDPDGLARKRQKIEEGCLERFLRENAVHLGVSTGQPPAGRAGQPIVSPVSPKRPEVIHVPRMTAAIKLEPLSTSMESQQMVTSSAAASSWAQPSPPQFMPLSPQQQQIRPQMDVLLSQQDYRQSNLSPSQLSNQQSMSQCSTQPEFLIPNIPNDTSKSMTSTLTTLIPVVGNGPNISMDTSGGGVIYDANSPLNHNSNQMNANSMNINDNEGIADEVMEKFDSLGLDIDTSELLSDMNFNSMSMMSALMDSTSSIGNSRENLLNSRDNILVSSSLQTPDIQTSGGPEDNARNLMANPQQMQSLQTKLIQLESNNININNNNNIVLNVVNNSINDKINNN